MTKTWSIGNKVIQGPLVLAPLAGIGDIPFRILCKRYGADLVYTEFVSAQGLLHKNKVSFKMLKVEDLEHPVTIQLFGSRPEHLAEAVKYVEQAGADFVDLNCGCPEPKVVRTGSGSALMSDPNLIARIVEAMVKSTSLPVTVKTRIGTRRGFPIAAEIARLCEMAGASAFALNCCYVSQGFAGPFDWEYIRTIKQTVKIPIIANGGIKNGKDVLEVLDKGADAAMVGRVTLGAPWAFEWIRDEMDGLGKRPIPLKERFSVMMEHLGLEVEMRGEKIGVSEMRKHWAWYVKGLPGASKFREEAVTGKTLQQMNDTLSRFREYLEKQGEER
ncbi:MAG: tRNA dihydrouridine synthase DusB [Caldisericales bacterium]|nr:tRNA dihydrouridine synthase DusB [Caldisericia bacterium]NMD14543.1 tRNA dihydrouridine synthase DusB [Caldisericales bacterium]